METIATRHGLARVEGTDLAVLDLPHADVTDLLRAGRSLESVAEAPVRERLPLERLPEVVVAPLRRPTVWGVGLNYHAKAELTGRPRPTFPTLYVKPVTALIGPYEPIVIPEGITDELDYEGELGIVIGTAMSHVEPDRVWDHVAGVIAANDVTARDVMAQTKNPLLAKGFPGVSPLGPSVLPISALADRDDVRVRCWVNDDLRQDARTSDLIFPVAELLATVSSYGRLEPGDVVLTGTAPGTGQDLGTYLRPGDRVTVVVGDMLPLVSPVVARPGPGAPTDTPTPRPVHASS